MNKGFIQGAENLVKNALQRTVFEILYILRKPGAEYKILVLLRQIGLPKLLILIIRFKAQVSDLGIQNKCLGINLFRTDNQ